MDMHKNYNIISVIVTAILFIVATGCEKDFLQQEPLVGSTEANYYQTAGDAQAAVIACYNPLQQEVTNVQGTGELAAHFRWFFGDIVSDDADKGGANPGDEPQLQQFATFSGQSTSKLILAEWQVAYKAIAYANIALEKIPAIEMDENTKARYLAEARFVRAYGYYNLVTMFGGVPLITETLSPSEFQQPRATEAEIWAQIEEDLTTAIPSLPQRSALSVNQTGRATWAAAQALLAKSYAWQQKWSACYASTDTIINSGEYFLDPSYIGMFSPAGENGSGSIWEIQYSNTSGGNWGNQLEGTFSNVFQRARGEFNGFGFNIPTQDFVDEFEEGDPRLSATVFQVGDQMGDRGEFTLEATGQQHLYYARKYFISGGEEASFGDPVPNGQSNDRVIRYADILLLHAEAAYHEGFEGVAITAVNQVRERARAGNTDVLPDVATSGQDLLEAIYHERRVELGLEGHRFFDLVRQGRGSAELGAAGFTSGVHERFPIPQIEITLSGGDITQPPG